MVKIQNYLKNYTVNSKSAHHFTPQNFCADTIMYVTKCPLQTAHKWGPMVFCTLLFF